jgi:hypothetical protein
MIPAVFNSGLCVRAVSSTDGVEPTNSCMDNSAAHYLAAHVVLWVLYLFGVGV